MEWTRQQRYQSYDHYTAQQLLELQRQAATDPAQVRYHLHPSSGLLNDPNGFSYFNGQWHLFYQSFPFGATHGIKSWMHTVSEDLVHWRDLGLAVAPDTKFDSHGAYSGSAKAFGDRLFLMYTGNHRDADWNRIPYQVGAWMDKDGQVTKLDHELFVNPPHFTEHFRDPQLLVKDGHYYALLGAQRTADKTGVADLWESDQLESGWHEVGEVDLGQSDLGYMVECPNYVDVDGRAVMIFCPQGLDHQTAPYQNIYPNMYLTGQDFDLTAPRLVNPDETLTNLDEGFDVYATQAFNAPDGTAYAVSWVGLPNTTYPTDDHNWANVMSQVKELHYRDGHLYQTPVEAMADLRHTHHATIFTGQPTVIKEDAGQQFELQVTIEPNQAGTLTLAGDQSLEHGVFLNFDTTAGQLVIDRAKAGQPVAEDHGTTRTLTVPGHQELKLDIFVDHSLIEIFVNDGYKVATLRYFADQSHGQVAFTNPTKATGTLWPIKPY